MKRATIAAGLLLGAACACGEAFGELRRCNTDRKDEIDDCMSLFGDCLRGTEDNDGINSSAKELQLCLETATEPSHVASDAWRGPRPTRLHRARPDRPALLRRFERLDGAASRFGARDGCAGPPGEGDDSLMPAGPAAINCSIPARNFRSTGEGLSSR
jgi:hypothetical protein